MRLVGSHSISVVGIGVLSFFITLSIISFLSTQGNQFHHYDSPPILFVIQLQLTESMHEWQVLVQALSSSSLLEWNKLPHEVRESTYNRCFQNKLLSLIHLPPKPVYSIHYPKSLTILTQLCVGLSMLNLHKFRHNFRGTLNLMCPSNEVVEDTEHFLLRCHSYDAYRTDFLDSVNSILQPYDLPHLSNALLLKMILYGDERLSVDSSSEILKATLRYIYATHCFE